MKIWIKQSNLDKIKKFVAKDKTKNMGVEVIGTGVADVYSYMDNDLLVEKWSMEKLKKPFVKTGMQIEVVHIELTNFNNVLHDGWKLIASIEDVGHTIIKEVEQSDFDYNTVSFKCDHCNTNRNRKHVFLIKKDDDYKIIGKTCINEYLGSNVLNQISNTISVYDMCKSDDDFNSSGDVYGYDLFVYLAAVEDCVKKYGFIRSQEVNSTCETAWGMMKDYRIEESRYNDVKQRVLAFKDTLVLKDGFNINLNNIIESEFVAIKSCGFAASIIAIMYNRDKKEKSDKVSDYFGEVGKKYKKILKLQKHYVIETMYGYQHLNILSDEYQNEFVYFGKQLGEPEDVYELSFKIKEHRLYKDKKQTIISYVKIVEN